MNPYDVLGVPKDATEDDIKKAYRKLAKTEHPDKGGNENRFKEINEAYETLSDPQKRRDHDNPDPFANAFGGNSFGFPFGFGDFFGGQQKRNVKSEPIVHVVDISLKESYIGSQKKLSIQTQKACDSCSEVCKICKGNGQYETIRKMGPMIQTMITQCDLCRGSGHVKKYNNACGSCHGKGSLHKEEIIKLELPPGTEQNTQFVFSQRGNKESGKEVGDLLVRIHISMPHNWSVNGNNIHYHHDISLADAICGSVITLEHPSSSEPWKFSTRDVESNVIDPKKRYIFSGKGMPKKGQRGAFGDFVVSFGISFDKVQGSKISSEDENHIRQILQRYS
jgi:DnaJ family protein A protein 2